MFLKDESVFYYRMSDQILDVGFARLVAHENEPVGLFFITGQNMNSSGFNYKEANRTKGENSYKSYIPDLFFVVENHFVKIILILIVKFKQ